MDQNPLENPTKENKGGRRVLNIFLLAAAFIATCILFFTAFNLFQPDDLSLSDIYFPSPTATNTRTPTPTPTPNMTATQQALWVTSTAQAIQSVIAKSGQWNILSSDDFNDNANNWRIGINDDERVKINRAITNGKYKWDATSKKSFISRVTADTTSVTDFFLTVEAGRTEGSPSSDYGLVFRKDVKNNFYYFGINDDSFHVLLNYGDEWINIVEWTTSNAIRPGTPNRLTVIARGSHFIFLINDRVVADAADVHISKGTAGLAIQLYSADLQATFEFDNFELREP